MTDLEKQVKELRDKYESPLREYVEGRDKLHTAIMECGTNDAKRMTKLINYSCKLYPPAAIIAAGTAVNCMDYMDIHDDEHDVFKESFIRLVNEWKTEMEKIDI